MKENMGLGAAIGNTRTVALIDTQGDVTWPVGSAARDMAFTLAPSGPYTCSQSYVVETGVLQTLYENASGRASMLDFLPVRHGAIGDAREVRVPRDRLVRIVEGLAGQIDFSWQWDPGVRSAVVLHTESDEGLPADGPAFSGAFSLAARDRRHFILTQQSPPLATPSASQSPATEAGWELDGTFDFWLAWGRLCPFQGAQRARVLGLATWLKAVWSLTGPAASPFHMLGPLALAAWGWEEDLASALQQWQPRPDDAVDRRQAAWLLDALAVGQATGLVLPQLGMAAWPRLWPMAESLAAAATAEGIHPDDRLAALAGCQGAVTLIDELLLPGDMGRLKAILQGEASLPTGDCDLTARCFSIRREHTTGAYLQARRLMDALLLETDPTRLSAARAGDVALALWQAAQLYGVAPPTPGRVAMPGDLGE